MNMPIWTDLTPAEKQEAIRPLWKSGKSAGEISRYFTGATRNSIISALHRGGMAGTSSKTAKIMPEKNPPEPKPQRKPSAISASAFTAHAVADPVSESVMHMIENNRAPLPGIDPIIILDLPNRPGVKCRFPVQGGYCGATSGDRMYCKTHHAVMYRPTEKMRMPREARL